MFFTSDNAHRKKFSVWTGRGKRLLRAVALGVALAVAVGLGNTHSLRSAKIDTPDTDSLKDGVRSAKCLSRLIHIFSG